MALIEEAHKAARTLLDHAYVRIVARAEPDATCAAALLAHALRRENVDFHLSWARRLDDPTLAALDEERPDCALLIGLSGDAAAAKVPAGRTLVLDNATPTLHADATVHDDAALASLAHLVAAGISKRNLDLAPLALAGATAALRHVGARSAGGSGWRGLDAEILKEAVDARVVLREASLSLHGQTLLQALAQLDAPYVAGLTGRARNAKKLVGELKLHGEGPASALAPDDARRLGDLLTLRLLQQGAPDAALDALFRPALRGLTGPHMGVECGEMARLAEAACAAERCGLAFAALWPDATAGGEMVDVVSRTREALVQALIAADAAVSSGKRLVDTSGADRDARREGRLLVVEAPRAALCRPLADRVALAHAQEGTLVAAQAEGFVALRGWGLDAAALARQAAPPAGALAAGAGTQAHLWAPDATRAVKALAEVLA